MVKFVVTLQRVTTEFAHIECEANSKEDALVIAKEYLENENDEEILWSDTIVPDTEMSVVEATEVKGAL